MVAKISFLSRGHNAVLACNSEECTLFFWVLPLGDGHGIINGIQMHTILCGVQGQLFVIP